MQIHNVHVHAVDMLECCIIVCSYFEVGHVISTVGCDWGSLPPSPVGSANDVAVTSPDMSLGVTGCCKKIAKDRDNVARMSRDVARMSRCRGTSRKIVRDRVHKASTVTST